MAPNVTTAVVPAEPRALEQRSVMLPAMSIAEAVERFNAVVEFTQTIMKPGKDFGEIPGTEKPTLLKPGAEKLSTFFGLVPQFVYMKEVEDWTGADHGGEPFFYYKIKCKLFRGDRFMGEGDGSCNSWESRYRYRWVGEFDVPPGLDRSRLKRRGGKISEFGFSIDKAETGGKYGKPAEYWQRFKDAIEDGTATAIKKKTQKGKVYDAWEIDSTLYRVPNTDIADVVNTILKIACKRALIAAVLIATNASEYYTQDLDDLEIINAEYTVREEAVPAAPAPSKNTNGHAEAKNPEPRSEAESPIRTEMRTLIEKNGFKAVADRLFAALIKHGFSETAILAKCGIAVRMGLTLDHLVMLRDDLNSLQSSSTPESPPSDKPKERKVTKKTLTLLLDWSKKMCLTPADKEELCAQCNCERYEDMTEENALSIVHDLRKAFERQQAAPAAQPQREPGVDEEESP